MEEMENHFKSLVENDLSCRWRVKNSHFNYPFTAILPILSIYILVIILFYLITSSYLEKYFENFLIVLCSSIISSNPYKTDVI